MLIACGRSALIAIVVFFVWGTVAGSSTAMERRPMNGIYITEMPADYESFELLVRKYKESGGDSIFIKPLSPTGGIDKITLAKAVFFAHGVGLKLFVVLPTRGLKELITENPDWEDMDYDPWSKSFERNGKIDLFNPSAAAFLLDLCKDIASYSIDGIIMDEDFYYGDREGQTLTVLKYYKEKYGVSFSPRKALGKLQKGDRAGTEFYGEGFWNLAELKKDVLLTLFGSIVSETRSVNKNLKFGISLHVPGLFLKEEEMLAWYGHNPDGFMSAGADFFWLSIPHRDIRQQRSLNYRKGMEAVSRKATATGMFVKGSSVLIAVQTVSSTGKPLPLTEIEEVSLQAKKAGEPGIVFMVTPDTDLPPVLTQKIFKGSGQ